RDSAKPQAAGSWPILSRGAGGLFLDLLDHHAHVTELGVAAFEKVVDLAAIEAGQSLGDELLQIMSSCVRIAMGAAERFGDDGVDHAELDQIAAGELECFGGVGGVLVAFPEN